MGWADMPPGTGTDVNAYGWVSQYWQAVRERQWALGAVAWPQSNFVWASGTVTAMSGPAAGKFTVTDAGAAYAVNRFAGYVGHAPAPVDYDLVFDSASEDQCVHVRISANTATTFTVDGTADHVIEDLNTGGFLGSANTAALIASLVGRTYYVIRRGGEWWHERWLQWPNDPERWVGLSLLAGALQPVTALTSAGTTATATCAGHQFANGETNIVVAGAAEANYNGTFTVTVLDADTFTYTMAGPASSPATTVGGITAKSAYVGARDATAAYAASAYATGHVLLVNGTTAAGGTVLLRRLALTGNSSTNLYFTRLSPDESVAGQYAVMPTLNSLGNPSRYRFYNGINALVTYDAMNADANPHAGPPYRWYHSAWADNWTRLPDDTLAATHAPASSVTLVDDLGVPYSVAAFDVDVWSSASAVNSPDKNYTSDLFRTLRGLQVALETMVGDNALASPGFVQATSYEGFNAASIPNFVRATWFYAAGINGQGGSTGLLGPDAAALYTSGISLPYYPINVFYAVKNADGSIASSGAGSYTVANQLAKDSGFFTSPGDEFKTLIVSPGWTRQYPNEFMYMAPKTAWVPELNGASYQDPPLAAFPGHWEHRQASTNYKKHDGVGIVTDATGTRPFVDGDFARYSGDNWNDPTIHPEISTSGGSPLKGYYNNLYEGKVAAVAQAAREALLTGTATAGDTFYLEDSTKNWWPGGVLYTDSGTADSGSTTDLGDSTKAGQPFWTTGVRGLLGFTVDVTIAGTVYHRRIAAYGGGTSISWIDALPATANGKAYAVRWPKYEANTFEGRTLRITLAGGGVHDVVVRSNDDHRLYFDTAAFSVTAGSTYQILEYTPGGVWQWDAATTSWVVPAGTDPTAGRGSVAWHADQTENLPTNYKEYGRMMKGDYVTQTLLTELYDAIQALVWVQRVSGWSGGETRSGSSAGDTVFGSAISDAKLAYDGGLSGSSDHPYAVAYAKTWCAGGVVGCYTYEIDRRYSYGSCTVPTVQQQSACDFYAFAKAPTDTLGSGGTTSAGCPSIHGYDPYGDGALYLQWHKFDTQGPAATTTRTSAAWGDAALPYPSDIGPAPAVCPIDCEWFAGYTVTNQTAILRYDVAGGFTYQ